MTKQIQKYYAHSLENKPESNWQQLEDHLRTVAQLAKSFAGEFGSAGWGYLAGLWHDLGKYSASFQRKIRQNAENDAYQHSVVGKVDHSTAGAIHAEETLGPAGRILAYLIAGEQPYKGDPHFAEGGPGGRLRGCSTSELPGHIQANRETIPAYGRSIDGHGS